MPFLQEGSPAESNYIGRQPARLLVAPDKILFVKRGFENEAARIREWIRDNGDKLRHVPSPGADPCSEETVKALGQNGESALRAAQGYVDQLMKVAEGLGEIAQTYGLVEDGNTQRFNQGFR